MSIAIARRLSVAAFAALLVTSVASAQSTGSSAGSGAGTTSSPTTPGSPQVNKELDLPLGKPDFKGGQPPKPPGDPNPPDNGDDKPPTIYGQEIKSETDTVFYVIDVSHSMSWDLGQYTTPDGNTATGNRLDRAKAELMKSVASLPQNFKFNMISYDCSQYPWQDSMQPADADHKQAAFGWIQGLTPLGATGTAPAVCAALGLRDNKLVVLLTDGAPNCGAGDGHTSASCNEAHRAMIRANNSQNAVIDVFGISATGIMKQFCMNVAGDNGGTYTDVR